MRKVTMVAATAPVWVVGFLLIAAPTYFSALFLNPPALWGCRRAVSLRPSPSR